MPEANGSSSNHNSGLTANSATSAALYRWPRERTYWRLPTAKESGFPNYVVTSWNGIGARASMPADLTNFLSAEINRSLASPELQERFRAVGIDPSGSTPDEMWDRMTRDAQKWREVIEKAGIPKQ